MWGGCEDGALGAGVGAGVGAVCWCVSGCTRKVLIMTNAALLVFLDSPNPRALPTGY